MIWVIVANTNHCHFYEYERKTKKLSLLKDLVHPESKLKNSHLISSAPGHYSTGHHTRGAYAPHTDPKAVEIDSFSREIAKELDKGRKTNSYHNFILMAEPHMNGLIRQHFNDQVKKYMLADIKKDYNHLTEEQLLEIIAKALQPF